MIRKSEDRNYADIVEELCSIDKKQGKVSVTRTATIVGEEEINKFKAGWDLDETVGLFYDDYKQRKGVTDS